VRLGHVQDSRQLETAGDERDPLFHARPPSSSRAANHRYLSSHTSCMRA
jgi:hypothetical protein